jgi:hypothetical protein
MINPQWGFNPIIIRMLFAVTLFQQVDDFMGLKYYFLIFEPPKY